MADWKCTDPILGSYEMEIGGAIYHGQRTVHDTVSVWLGADRLTVKPNLAEARNYVERHASREEQP